MSRADQLCKLKVCFAQSPAGHSSKGPRLPISQLWLAEIGGLVLPASPTTTEMNTLFASTLEKKSPKHVASPGTLIIPVSIS